MGKNVSKVFFVVFFFFKSWLHMESSAEARPQIKRPKSEGGAGSTNIQRT